MMIGLLSLQSFKSALNASQPACFVFRPSRRLILPTEKRVVKHAKQNYLPASRLVFDVLSGADLGLNVLQVRHRCNRSDRGARSQ